MKLDPDESIVSFDVSALFTSIPVKEALEVVKELLEREDSWKSGEAENLKTEDVIQLLDFCLSTTYFVFREKFYQQKDGCAMGSPCSPLVANAYMEYFEKRALDSAPHPPRIWKRYVDDTFCVIKSAYIDESQTTSIIRIGTSSLPGRKRKTGHYLSSTPLFTNFMTAA